MSKETQTSDKRQTGNSSLGVVSGSLPITSNDHLNELIKAYNKDKYDLIKFIEKVWNSGYNKGYWKGHSGQ